MEERNIIMFLLNTHESKIVEIADTIRALESAKLKRYKLVNKDKIKEVLKSRKSELEFYKNLVAWLQTKLYELDG